MVRKREGEPMPSLDERVAYLEGRLEDHASTVIFLREDVRAVHEDLRSFREEFRNEISHFRGEVRQELNRFDDKLSRHFTWLIGIQVGVLIAALGALLGN
jgi:hypothetical protein